MRVLFVCSGNICRSPMAESYFVSRVARSGLSHVLASSAGTLGLHGAPASAEAIEVARDAGADLRAHRSKALTASLVRASDWILAMAAEHVDEIRRRFPKHGAKVHLLRSFEAGPEPVEPAPDRDDPIGCPIDTYRECFEIIRPCIDHFLIHLRHLR